MIIKIIFDSINLIFLSLATFICIAILILIFWHIRPLISNIPILLTCNTYISLGLVNIVMLIIYAYNFYGDLYQTVSVNNSWCQFRAYMAYSGYTALYYSCLLQSMFRLFRVIFYRQRILQSSLYFMIAIIIQWILSFLIPLYNYLHNDYQYIPLEYRCWISFTNILGLGIALVTIYLIPLTSMIFIYLYLLGHVRRPNHRQRHQWQRISNERDMLILKRIVMCVVAMCALGIPSVIIWFIYMVNKYLIPLSYHIQGLSLVIGLFLITVCFIFITPQIKDIFKQNRRQILPMTVIKTNQMNVTVTIQQQQQRQREDKF